MCDSNATSGWRYFRRAPGDGPDTELSEQEILQVFREETGEAGEEDIADARWCLDIAEPDAQAEGAYYATPPQRRPLSSAEQKLVAETMTGLAQNLLAHARRPDLTAEGRARYLAEIRMAQGIADIMTGRPRTGRRAA